MAAPTGLTTGINVFPFFNDTVTTISTANATIPSTADLGVGTTPSANKLVATANYMPTVKNAGNFTLQANEFEVYYLGQDASERLPGTASTQSWSFTFAMEHGNASCDKWIAKVPGDFIEGAIIIATGDRISSGGAYATARIPRPNFNLRYFKGTVSGADFSPGGENEEAMSTLTVAFTDPVVYYPDATAADGGRS